MTLIRLTFYFPGASLSCPSRCLFLLCVLVCLTRWLACLLALVGWLAVFCLHVVVVVVVVVVAVAAAAAAALSGGTMSLHDLFLCYMHMFRNC